MSPGPPSQDASGIHAGLGWDPLEKNIVILVVTGILGGGTSQLIISLFIIIPTSLVA